MKPAITVVLLALAMSLTFNLTLAAPSGEDHLVPIVEYLGNAPLYRDLWQRKLFVTPGNVARYVHLPAFPDIEVAVSVYQDKQKAGGLPGAYWVTVTEPASPLSDCIPSANIKNPVSPTTVRVQRDDAPLPQSTALIIGKLWLTMLQQSRPEPDANRMPIDSTTEVFSAQDANGKVLEAQVPVDPQAHTLALVRLGNSLANYAVRDRSDQANLAREIERQASDLLSRVSAKQSSR